MNGYANADTFFAANFVLNTESIHLAARRITDPFRLRNLLADAQFEGMLSADIEINNIEYDEILDVVLED